MIRFNIIGHGFLDVAETGGIAFKTQNQHFRFCDISLGRSVEFSVPATDHNRQMLDFGEDAAESGEMLRRVYPCQLVYDGGAKMGTIMVTGFAGEAFSCVFTIGNAEWLQAIQERKLADCTMTAGKGVSWAAGAPVYDANAADPDEREVIVRYENGFLGNGWQLVPSVNIKTYLVDLFTNLGIPFSSSIDSKYWMVAGSLKGGGMDSVTLTQTDNTSFALSQTQTYFSIEDITIEWATANLFGALVGGGSASSKAYKVGADIKITFPYSLTAHNYLIRWNAKLKRCEVLGTTNTGSTTYKDLNGATLDLEKGDIVFFASKPLIDATTYYGWKAGDISAIAVSATVERNADLQLGEVWYLRNNQPDMTVFEFLKSVALAAGLELTVDGETGVTMTAGAYGTNTTKALERVIAAESVTRRVESWGSGTQKAVVKFDSEEYVTEPINADFVIDNDQFDEVSEHVSKFSEGNVGTNGILIEDVEAGPKFKAKKWTIAFVDTNSTYLQRVPTPDPVGYDDLATNSTCLRAKIAAPLAEFFDLQPSTVYVWRGCAYLWTDADWSDGVLGLTLQRVSQPQTSVSPTPPPPEPKYDALVEYLESDGTQYINLGIKPEANEVIKIKFKRVSGTGFAVYLGSRGGVGDRQCYIGQYNSKFVASIGTTNSTALANYDTNEHTITMDTATGLVSIDGGAGVNCGTFVASSFDICLFALNTNGTIANNSKIQIMEVEIGTRMSLRPCRKNGVGYMYDAVSDSLLTNNGIFAYGNDI